LGIPSPLRECFFYFAAA
jgi:hypothetical protein